MDMSPADLNRQLQEESRPLILDVRTPAEFAEMAIEGSISMPLDQLDPQAVEGMMGANHASQACVVVCHTGKRSRQASDKLVAAGLEGVSSLEGGLELWERKGLSLQRRQKAGFSIIRQVHIVAGSMIFAGVLLSATVSPWWAILPGFFGAGLLFAGLTGFCGMGLLLAKMPWNRV